MRSVEMVNGRVTIKGAGTCVPVTTCTVGGFFPHFFFFLSVKSLGQIIE